MNIRCMETLSARRRGALVAILMACAVGLAPVSPAWGAQPAGSVDDNTGTPSGVAMQAAAWLASVPYGALKLAYAASGGIIGGVTYVLSGGNRQAADAVWVPSVYGNYVLSPAQLRGQEPIHFVGTRTPNPPHAAQAAPAPGGARQDRTGASVYPLQPREPPAR
ncbi:hypothetical protein BMS3Bbin12_00580 [bacterium BMS3Bbin12]|nr:hypothetical protein BMS3Abin12_01427 [bacterium BMS3Abin12]GBE47420.1 hypothetical protein BMS3Bbin12_00580 [bacterium BMS3Bbin12]GBE51100.1 hypothetical protein BMS3Bbin13_02055 [bacterium BMS3Bbin13]